jgi:hypothetical protein
MAAAEATELIHIAAEATKFILWFQCSPEDEHGQSLFHIFQLNILAIDRMHCL